MKIYVGGLPTSVTEEALQSLFASFGDIAAVNLVKDGTTKASRGFGFLEMPVREEAEKAVSEMSGKDIEGQTITVEPARERARGGGRSGGFGRGRQRSGRSGTRR